MRARLRVALLFLAFAIASGFAWGQGTANAQAVDLLALARIDSHATSDPAMALEEIDKLLAQLAAEKSADPRVLFDLQRLAGDILTRQGRWREAGQVLAVAARYAVRNRDVLDADPADLWTRSADAQEKARNWRGAIDALEGLLTEQRDGGLPSETIVGTLDRMAGLAESMGDAQKADMLREDAALARRASDPNGTRGDGTGFTRVEVFYATDRARTGAADTANYYGYDRGKLDYGMAVVTVPDSHVPGAIEKPSVWHLEFSASPTKHVVLRSVTPVTKQAFFSDLRSRVERRTRKEAFVFIHGYNVSFASAAKRAGQLAYDMNFIGVPILYSWPSRDSTAGYMSDAAVVQLSARRLSRFLDDVVAQSGATTIHIIAHSMGNRALTEALELMSLRRQQTADMAPPFDQVVFAAPDVDAGLFAEMLPTIRPLARRMTLYASENDWALVTSRHLHGDAPRAGQGGPDTLALAQIDSLDMSELGDDMLAHGYFASDRSALVDLAALFWRNSDPANRCGLEKVVHDNGIATWRYVAGICPDTAILAAIGQLQKLGVSTRSEAHTALSRIVPSPDMSRRVEPVLLKLLPP
ncbi:MAG: alpha/beta hydrolase [Albidovulum sp.]